MKQLDPNKFATIEEAHIISLIQRCRNKRVIKALKTKIKTPAGIKHLKALCGK